MGGQHHYGEEVKESEEQQAERLTVEALKVAGWKEAELNRRGKADRTKVLVARHLRRETTMTWRWIAERLEMGHWRAASKAIRKMDEGNE